MRILAITFALALIGCVDDTTPEGIDDIEEANEDYGPDTHKNDVDQFDPFASPNSIPQSLEVQPIDVNAGAKAPATQQPNRADGTPNLLNPVPDSTRR